MGKKATVDENLVKIMMKMNDKAISGGQNC